MGDAFETLSVTKNMVFDFSANTNDHVFEAALRAFGPERCLFGSDMPITRMRMRRICEGGKYINVVPRGLYGDVSGDMNMREAIPPESDSHHLLHVRGDHGHQEARWSGSVSGRATSNRSS